MRPMLGSSRTVVGERCPVDFFRLARVNGSWKIVSKTFAHTGGTPPGAYLFAALGHVGANLRSDLARGHAVPLLQAVSLDKAV